MVSKPHSLPFFIFLLTCFWSLSLQEVIQINYYIDPTSTESETGEQQAPFHTLNAAFHRIQEDSALYQSSDSLNITLFVREATTISEFADSPTLFLDDTERTSTVIRITTFSEATPSKPKPATLFFSDPSAHWVFVTRESKLIIQNFVFSFNLPQGIRNTELIRIEGVDNKFVLSNCAFNDTKLNLNNPKIPVFLIKNSQALIRNCSFSNINSMSSFFDIQQSTTQTKFEFNLFNQVQMEVAPLIHTNGIRSFAFSSNMVRQTKGKFLETVSTPNLIITGNKFEDISGQYPINLNTAQNIVFDDNHFYFLQKVQEGSQEGLVSLLNFNAVSFSGLIIEEYSGKTPAVSVSLEEIYGTKSSSMISVKDSKFNKNSLYLKNVIDQEGLSVFKTSFKQKVYITFENTEFKENRVFYKETDQIARKASSTIWIDSEAASLKINNCTFMENQASRVFTNIYVNSEHLSVTKSRFIKNTQVNSENSVLNNIGQFNNFVWYADDLTFSEDFFQENSGDKGGAISIIEHESPRVPKRVSIQSCEFTKNHAKIGGAIYTDIVASDVLDVIHLEGNKFFENQADEYPNYNPSPLFTTEKKKELFLKFITKEQQSKIYRSGELRLRNIDPEAPLSGSLFFFISDDPKKIPNSEDRYISTVQIVKSMTTHGPVFFSDNMTRAETGDSIKFTSVILSAPLNSSNVLRLEMENKGSSAEKYVFEIPFTIMQKATPIVCEVGEYIDTVSKGCLRCPAGTYSLVKNATGCLECPIGANCSKGGNEIEVLPGYWRNTSVTNITVVMACSSSGQGHCLGGLLSACEVGYTGPLCKTCDIDGRAGHGKHRPVMKDTCAPCKNLTTEDILTDVVTIGVPFLILIYTLYILLSSSRKNEDVKIKRLSTCMYINIFISYMQSLFILHASGYITLPKHFALVLGGISNPSFATFGYLTCHLDIYPFSQAATQVVSLYGIVLLAKVSAVVLTVLIFSRSGRKIILGLIWFAFLETPGVLDFILRFFDCSSSGISALNLGLECNNDTFTSLRTYLLIPIVVFFTLTFPLIVTYSLISGALRSDEQDDQKKLKMMLIARSSEFISKSNRNWFSFFWISFGRFGLLILGFSNNHSLQNYMIVGLYFATNLLFNSARKLMLADGWRSNLLFIDNLVILLNLGIGFMLSAFENWNLRDNLTNGLWVFNVAYLAIVYGGALIRGKGEKYNQLEEVSEDQVEQIEEESGQNSSQ